MKKGNKMNFIHGIIVVVGIGLALVAKVYMGDTMKEHLVEDVIEKVVEVETGVDIDPFIEDKK